MVGRGARELGRTIANCSGELWWSRPLIRGGRQGLGRASRESQRPAFAEYTSTLRPREHGREVTYVLAVGLVDVADTDLCEVCMEQVGAVQVTVHPPVKGRLRRGAAAGEDVFAHPRPQVALRVHPLPHVGAVRSGMREEIVAGHVCAVPARGGLQLTLRIIGSQSLALSLCIDQGHQSVFIPTVSRRAAARIGR